MYAVIETGGKQYRVEVGTVLEVEKLDAEAGATVTLDRVLLVADGDDASVGQPVVDGASVSAEVLRQDRAEKVIVFKYRPKARRRVKKGHRQDITVLRIADITIGGRSAAEAAEAAAKEAKTERQRLEEAAAKQAAADAALAAKLAERAAVPAEGDAKPKAKRTRAKAAPKPEAETAGSAEPETIVATPESVEASEPAESAAPTETVAPTETTAPTETAGAPSGRAFEIYEDKAGGWRWRLRASNGELIAMSEQGFSSKASVVRSLESVRRNVAEAVDHVEAEEGAEAGTIAGFEIYEDKAGGWRWRLRASNGDLLAIPEQGFSSRASVVRALESVRRNVAEATRHEEAGAADETPTDETPTDETTTSAAPPRKRASRTKKDE